MPRTTRMKAAMLALGLAFATACGSDEAGGDTNSETPVASSTAAATGETTDPELASPAPIPADDGQADGEVVIDVRTPEEFTAGHLQGALNLDLAGGVLAEQLESLDPDAEYLVYCRSGARSAEAAALMAAAGLTVVDGGSLEEAAEHTGLDVVGR